MSGMQPHDPKCPGWTDTLQRAAELIARAYTNREMAEIEFVTMHGAKKQVGRVRQHLEVDDDVRRFRHRRADEPVHLGLLESPVMRMIHRFFATLVTGLFVLGGLVTAAPPAAFTTSALHGARDDFAASVVRAPDAL